MAFFLLIVTEIQVTGSAHGTKVLFGEGRKVIKLATPLVILKASWVSIFDGWITLDTVFTAEGLFDGAIYVSDESGR